MFKPDADLRSACFAMYLKDGREAIAYRASYQDVLDSSREPERYQKAFLLHRVLRIDGRPVSVDAVLALDNFDAETLLKHFYAAMRR